MTDWRVIRTGAFGVEFTLWCGVGWGTDLFHAYVKLGIATLYVSRFPLIRVLSMWRAARDKLKNL